MTHDMSRYRQGYSVGVGGVVLCGDRALLVRRALGQGVGDWAIPGGFVEPQETMDVAAQREVLEEAGVQAAVEGVMAVRSRTSEAENSAYVIFLLRAADTTAQPDGVEVDQARFFTLDEALALPRLQGLSRLVITQALQGQARVLTFSPHPQFSPDEYVIYA